MMTHPHWIEQALWALSSAIVLATVLIAVIAVAEWANG
jgi:hypothetical protein